MVTNQDFGYPDLNPNPVAVGLDLARRRPIRQMLQANRWYGVWDKEMGRIRTLAALAALDRYPDATTDSRESPVTLKDETVRSTYYTISETWTAYEERSKDKKLLEWKHFPEDDEELQTFVDSHELRYIRESQSLKFVAL
jgi:hypothetical protein